MAAVAGGPPSRAGALPFREPMERVAAVAGGPPSKAGALPFREPMERVAAVAGGPPSRAGALPFREPMPPCDCMPHLKAVKVCTLSGSIQNITEATADALEALLNSTRYYVADSNAKILEIFSRVSRLWCRNDLRVTKKYFAHPPTDLLTPAD